MKSSRLAIAFLSLAALCCAQQQHLSVEPPEQLTVKRGAEFTAAIKVSVQSGFHVNSDKPKDEFLIPLQLTWSAGPSTAKSVSYPQPEEIKVGSENLMVFTGNFEIQTTFHAIESAAALPTSLVGKLKYQACNNQMCFRPSSLEIRLPVVVQ